METVSSVDMGQDDSGVVDLAAVAQRYFFQGLEDDVRLRSQVLGAEFVDDLDDFFGAEEVPERLGSNDQELVVLEDVVDLDRWFRADSDLVPQEIAERPGVEQGWVHAGSHVDATLSVNR